MNIGVLGSGMVGQAIGKKLVEIGHQVRIGTRDPQKLSNWLIENHPGGSVGSFTEAAQFGEILFNCVSGSGSLPALAMAGEAHLNSKILIDISNPLDFSKGFPPSLTICNTDSLGEQIQRAFPSVRVVKSLNTVNANLMVNPGLLPGEHDIFVCGNDVAAREQVAHMLKNWFGWKSVIDLGDLSASRGLEMLLPFWVRMYATLQSPLFNFKIVKQDN